MVRRLEVGVFAVSLGADGAELRPLEPWHAGEFLAHIDRGRDFIGQFIGLADAVTDPATSRAFLLNYADKAAIDIGRIYGIWLDGTLLGGVLFRTMDLANGHAEVGCWLEPDGVGKGLVTRGARTIIDWAIEQRGIHRIDWWVASANEPSIAVAKRLGMTKEGTLREYRVHRGKRHDLEIWSVLAPEWRANKV